MKHDDTGALLALGLWTLAIFLAGAGAGWVAHEGKERDARRVAAELAVCHEERAAWEERYWRPQRVLVEFPPGWTCEGNGWGVPPPEFQVAPPRYLGTVHP